METGMEASSFDCSENLEEKCIGSIAEEHRSFLGGNSCSGAFLVATDHFGETSLIPYDPKCSLTAIH